MPERLLEIQFGELYQLHFWSFAISISKAYTKASVWFLQRLISFHLELAEHFFLLHWTLSLWFFAWFVHICKPYGKITASENISLVKPIVCPFSHVILLSNWPISFTEAISIYLYVPACLCVLLVYEILKPFLFSSVHLEDKT